MTDSDITIRQQEDDKMVDEAFHHLLDTYMSSQHRKKKELITKAYNFAREAHKGVRRLSGEPYIMHPIAVAQIVSEEMGLGSTSICAALLHDVVEDTDYTVEDIENIFGPKIAQIVDGLTKISGGIFGDKASAQAENFKKLLLTMSDDIRVILIKICDRLHNMRTLASQPPNKQYKIAGETLYIYAPLAYRLGLNKIKSELEDLSFRYEHPDEYKTLSKKIADSTEHLDTLFEQFSAPIREKLNGMGIKYKIKARVKSPYSVWHKMQTKHVTFEEIYDLLAVRIVFTPKIREEEINECFNIYVAISRIYKSHPDRLRDWLNHPKANGYQALHVTLMSKQGHWIEVQIRSDHMDEVAEKGFAAHWKYKDSELSKDSDGELDNWLSTIKEILDDPQPDAIDFLDTIKLNLFASEIFVFTPKGEIMTMPAGCTALDFAFQIHTFLGSHCIGAKVNHKLVPLNHVLQSGDQVEILTSKSQHPKPDWIDFVSSAKAKAKIQAILRRDNREVQKQGQQQLEQWLASHELELTSAAIDKLCEFHNVPSPDKLFLAIGNKTIVPGDGDVAELTNRNRDRKKTWRRFVPFISSKKGEGQKPDYLTVGDGFNKKKTIYVSEENIDRYIFPGCCHPIPGDDILGFIDSKKRIEIHLRDCETATKLKSSYGNRILDAKWDMHGVQLFDATISIRGIDRRRMLHDLAEAISGDPTVNIRRVTINTAEGLFDGEIEVSVHDRTEERSLINSLKKIDGLKEVKRL